MREGRYETPDKRILLLGGYRSSVKLLGLNLSSDLWWNCHVAEISKYPEERPMPET